MIQKISNNLVGKFKFGYHEIEDMQQQVFIEVLKPDRNGLNILDKFQPDRGNSLESFLWVHIRNRLFNFKRNNYFRPDKPCDNCPLSAYINFECTAFNNMMECPDYSKWHNKNNIKKTLMSTKEANDRSHETKNLNDILASKEIYDLLDKNIPVSQREIWLRFVNKSKISKTKKDLLIETIYEILIKNGINLCPENEENSLFQK